MKSLFYWTTTMLVFFFCGCASTGGPKTAEYPRQIRQSYDYSYDRLWQACSDIVCLSKGKIFTQDKASGVISGSISFGEKKQISGFFNLYVRRREGSSLEVLFFVKEWDFRQALDREFFQKLNEVLRKNDKNPCLQEVDIQETNSKDKADFPDAAWMKKQGKLKKYPGVTFDDAWDSLILSLTQRRTILQISKDKGIIIFAPASDQEPGITIYVKQQDKKVNLYMYFNKNSGRHIPIQEQERLLGDIFDLVATQMYVQRKVNREWSYLFKEENP